MPPLLSSMGEISHLKCNFKSFQKNKPEIFPCRAFLFCVVDDCFSKCPNSKKTPLPQKIPGYAPEMELDEVEQIHDKDVEPESLSAKTSLLCFQGYFLSCCQNNLGHRNIWKYNTLIKCVNQSLKLVKVKHNNVLVVKIKKSVSNQEKLLLR